MIISKYCVIMLLVLASAPKITHADESKFMCGKFKADALADLKEKLLTNCNLDKPYSFSTQDVLDSNKPTVIYCCHKR